MSWMASARMAGSLLSLPEAAAAAAAQPGLPWMLVRSWQACLVLHPGTDS